jgi:hypothetical protein
MLARFLGQDDMWGGGVRGSAVGYEKKKKPSQFILEGLLLWI